MRSVSTDSAAVLDALEDYIIELHEEWKDLKELFASGEANFKVLHETAGALFDTIYRVLIRDLILGVARLTDPLATVGHENLVLGRILVLPEVAGDPELATAATEALTKIVDLVLPFREYRNKYLAHLDLSTSLAEQGDIIPGIKRDDVEATLTAFATLFNRIDGPLRNRDMDFEHVTLAGGPNDLIRACEDARKWRSIPGPERREIGKRLGFDG